MIFHLGAADRMSRVVETSRHVERVEADSAVPVRLQTLGVDYLYVGHRGDLSGLGLDSVMLRQAEGTTLLYEKGGVSIFRIGPP